VRNTRAGNNASKRSNITFIYIIHRVYIIGTTKCSRINNSRWVSTLYKYYIYVHARIRCTQWDRRKSSAFTRILLIFFPKRFYSIFIPETKHTRTHERAHESYTIISSVFRGYIARNILLLLYVRDKNRTWTCIDGTLYIYIYIYVHV